MNTHKLSANKVRYIIEKCLFSDGESTDGAVIVEGVINRFAFHPVRVKEHANEISELLMELPDEFHSDKGGGWSFLNACMDRHGNQWAEHPTIELLFALGIATGQAKCQLPKSMWGILPGGMPYFSVTPIKATEGAQ